MTFDRNPLLRYLDDGDLRFAVWEWPGTEPALLFAHATSFHGRCWDEIVRAFPERRCLAVEARGHGRSSKPAPPYHWDALGQDLLAMAEQLQLRGAIGIGHSMGGHTVTAVAAARTETFAGLVLVDPTIRVPELYGGEPMDVAFVRKRRRHWASVNEMFERFRGRPPFEHWNLRVLRAYCEFGLLPDGDAFVLACPPEVEASIYEGSTEREANLHGVIPSIAQPVTVIRAGYQGERHFSTSPTDPDLASRFPRGCDVLLAGHSHFIPMETPETVAEQIRRML